MANSSSSSAEGMPPRCGSVAVRERHDKIVAAKNRWEEQGFFFDDSLENYGLEPIIYKRLNDLGWFRFVKQPARANLNWVMEFYANNADGDDTVTVRGRRVPANSATINSILDLPNDSPSIYALIDILEDEDLDTIKDQLCKQGTEWNVKGKNPKTISSPHLQPEAKLWKTFVKHNLMPTSHNQTVDRTRLVLINAIITGYKFNVGEVITKEQSEACQNDKGILSFPCIISALCRRATVLARPADKYTMEKFGWTRKEYMRKMEVTDAIPIQMVMPTPPASEQAEPSAPVGAQPSPATGPAPTPAATPVTSDSRQSTPNSPLGSTPNPPPSPPPARSEEAAPSPPPSPPPARSEEASPFPPPSPPPARSEEAVPFHILQLRRQLQQIEARQLQFMEETKVFQTSLINFLCFQFPNDVAFFTAHPTTTQPANFSAATQPKSTPKPSKGAGNTEKVNFSSDDENDIFDWHTPMEH
ncbi:hypothetical protein V6N11_020016 [Hibiscus sabdariffa]|uniref:Putative plant transposon protein domain-containing protein n=1 Tax=Hibiscus sabdariffa TaxID=183260 RepID=A0ABR2P8D4_9ROSI